MDPSLLESSGAPRDPSEQFTSLATIRFIGGLQTQRSAFASIDNRYNARYLGGKPDALIAGQNVEISNKLVLQRRPGVVAYGTLSIPAPLDFFKWNIISPPSITLVVDTAPSVYQYSTTSGGIYVNKSTGSGQTNFMSLANTLYMGNGSDLYKIVGPNLLTQSNTFSNAAWSVAEATLLQGVVDPKGGNAGTTITWSIASYGTFISQVVSPNYTPVAGNNFTFSVWLQQPSGSQTLTLQIKDQSGTVLGTQNVSTSGTAPNKMGTTWTQFQVSGTGLSTSTSLTVLITNASGSTTTTNIYGAQLEVGGPMSPTQITTIKPQGVYLWGMVGPTNAPVFTSSQLGTPWAANTPYTIGTIVVDSNGNYQQVVSAGTSGFQAPIWSVTQGGLTSDNQLNFALQKVSAFNTTVTGGGQSLSLVFPNAVNAGSTILVFIHENVTNSLSVTDTNGGSPDTFTRLQSQGPFGNYEAYAYAAVNVVGGTTTVNLTGAGTKFTWACAVEVPDVASVQASATTGAGDNLGTGFSSGSVTTVNAIQVIYTAALMECGAALSNFLAGTPSGYTSVDADVFSVPSVSNAATNENVAYILTTAIGTYSPNWTVSSVYSPNSRCAFTVALSLTAGVGSLVWKNIGPAGLSPKNGYNYYYSWYNSTTGHVSNVSAISASTGAQVSQLFNVSGDTNTIDPQADSIMLFRNTDGGPFYFLVDIFGNGASYNTNAKASYSGSVWTYVDSTPDTGLNTQIYAPIGLLNTPPPAGSICPAFWAGRVWVAVGSTLYYSTGADNASAINILQNGVPAESFAPANTIPFDAPIYRLEKTAIGLAVFTGSDVWLVTGQDLTSFNPVPALSGHGIRSYNAVDDDGSTFWIWTSDRQFLSANFGAGSAELGFPIGDILEGNGTTTGFQPTQAYVARHISGSRDNAVYLADGSTGWYRLNPNQQGASAQGELAPVWSPKADFTATLGGISAIASIETSFGVKQLLIGYTGTGGVEDFEKNTGLGANLTTSGGTAWTNPTYVELNNPLTPTTISMGPYTAPLSDWLSATTFGLSVPTGTITGLEFIVSGYQTSSAPDAYLTLSYKNPVAAAPSYTFQLPSTQGSVVLGGPSIDWNQDLTQALVNASAFGCEIQAQVSITSCVFNISSIQARVFIQLPSTTAPVYVRNMDTYSDAGQSYTWSATIGSILLANPGKLAEVSSITTQLSVAPSVSQPTVGVLFDEISGSFESLPLYVNDPPQLNASTSVLTARFYTMQGSVAPVCQHMQIQLAGIAAATKDELLMLNIIGALVPEMKG